MLRMKMIFLELVKNAHNRRGVFRIKFSVQVVYTMDEEGPCMQLSTCVLPGGCTLCLCGSAHAHSFPWQLTMFNIACCACRKLSHNLLCLPKAVTNVTISMLEELMWRKCNVLPNISGRNLVYMHLQHTSQSRTTTESGHDNAGTDNITARKRRKTRSSHRNLCVPTRCYECEMHQSNHSQ